MHTNSLCDVWFGCCDSVMSAMHYTCTCIQYTYTTSSVGVCTVEDATLNNPSHQCFPLQHLDDSSHGARCLCVHLMLHQPSRSSNLIHGLVRANCVHVHLMVFDVALTTFHRRMWPSREHILWYLSRPTHSPLRHCCPLNCCICLVYVRTQCMRMGGPCMWCWPDV